MMKKQWRYIFLIIYMVCLLILQFFEVGAQQKKLKAGAWGDQLNGTYKNPVLNADYSDPDVIRVGNSFYMVCSDFNFMRMSVLQSPDLVNWKIIGRVYSRLDIDAKYNTMEKYGAGSWAPALRFHNGRFYVYFCSTPVHGTILEKLSILLTTFFIRELLVVLHEIPSIC